MEKYGLLPTNHFGARKQRSAEHALLLLQEHIYTAWRRRQVVSLISFDVKGAYNGVCKDRLVQRLAARGIPVGLVNWIDDFCSARAATIVVNGRSSEVRELEQPGLPQGSPLSPILFLFFNADLVQQKIDQNGGAIAFVDEYTARVVGKTAAENPERLRTVVQLATRWESRSGASLEGEKTSFIHFTRNSQQSSDEPITVKGQEVRPAPSVKILGLIMDSELRYKEHTARAATRGLRAAMALKRLRGLSPSVTRKLFTVTVAPVVNYASSVWMHARGVRADSVLNRVGQAVIGCFRTVGTAVAEAEANLPTIKERHLRKASKTWVDLHSMPDTHPLARLAGRRICKRFVSPMQRIAEWARCLSLTRLETTRPYISAPWDERVQTLSSGNDALQAAVQAQQVSGIRIATSASPRNELVGIGGVIDGVSWANSEGDRRDYDSTIGSCTQVNAYTAALAAIEVGVGLVAHAVSMGDLSPRVQGQTIHVFTSNRAVLTALQAPTRRSGQAIVSKILRHADSLSKSNDRVVFMWAPASPAFELGQRAK